MWCSPFCSDGSATWWTTWAELDWYNHFQSRIVSLGNPSLSFTCLWRHVDATDKFVTIIGFLSEFVVTLHIYATACWCFYSLDAMAQRKAPPVQSGVCAVMWLAGCCWRSVLLWYSVPVFLNLRWFSHMDLIVFFFWLWVFSRSAESVACCSFTSLCLLSGNSLELSGSSLFTV